MLDFNSRSALTDRINYLIDKKIDFERINAIAMSNIETVLHRWLPDGTDILGVQRIGPDGEKKVNPGGILSGRVNLKH